MPSLISKLVIQFAINGATRVEPAPVRPAAEAAAGAIEAVPPTIATIAISAATNLFRSNAGPFEFDFTPAACPEQVAKLFQSRKPREVTTLLQAHGCDYIHWRADEHDRLPHGPGRPRRPRQPAAPPPRPDRRPGALRHLPAGGAGRGGNDRARRLPDRRRGGAGNLE